MDQKIRDLVFYVAIISHGTHYGPAIDHENRGSAVSSSTVTNINDVVRNIVQVFPNMRFFLCGTCRTGLLLSS